MLLTQAYLLFALLIRVEYCYFIVRMNPQEQIQTFDFLIDDNDYFEFSDLAFAYGLWSRYTPLSQIAQIGNVGLFDSNCFHYHNAADKMTGRINFIYYDCLDQENDVITKTVKFIDNQQEQHVFQFSISNDQYEYIWYYFQIIQWPQVSQFKIIIIKYPDVVLEEQLKIKYPYYNNNLLLTFGGGGIVRISISQVNFESTLIQLSYFPGTMMLYQLELTRINPVFQLSDLVVETFIYQQQCQCYQNMQYIITEDNFFQNNNILYFSSPNYYCDTFQLGGWLKMSNIVSDGSDFSYKILKMTTASLNSRLTTDNLSPFCLIFAISDQGNKLIYTTYSYKTPTVNIDISKTPYLVKREFNLHNALLLWQYFSVTLNNNILDIKLTFYEGQNSYRYDTTIQVFQFHMVAYSVQIGNLEGNYKDYILFKAHSIIFFNCQTENLIESCHTSCFLCDGPTQFDCVTCQENRQYLSHQRSCVCLYNALDDGDCLSDNRLGLTPFTPATNGFKCQYGYFEIDQQCFKCPMISKSEQINCIECLTNSTTWKNILYCTTSLISKNDSTYTVEEITQINLIFDNEDLIQNREQNCLSIQCIFSDYENTQIISINENSCNILHCSKCGPQTNYGSICIICEYYSILQDGICIDDLLPGQQQQCISNCAYCTGSICQACSQQYYLTSDKRQCLHCDIENCQYCFEFLSDDLRQSTLYKGFIAFDHSEYVQVGCSLCLDGFNYNFITRKCIYQNPGVTNCKRSFIDLNNIEVCILSAIDDFNIAPQIINCELRIPNCQQCILTQNLFVMCILCQNGYTASITTGQCNVSVIEYSFICLEGDFRLKDFWVQQIQSFMMQFLPDHYFYPRPTTYYFIDSFALSCITGFQPNTVGICRKYCDSNCLMCVEDFRGTFQCNQCSVNYYGITLKSQKDGSCLNCPLLCTACQERTSQEIYNVNPYFIVTNENNFQTFRCLRAIQNENIMIDSETNVATYFFDLPCTNSLQQRFSITCDNVQFILRTQFQEYYEYSINILYCNQMGIRLFQVIFDFEIVGNCATIQETILISTSLKSQIFSLQQTSLLLIGSYDLNNYQRSNLTTSYFDIVEIKNFYFFVQTGLNLIFSNHNLPLSLIVSDSMFYGYGDQVLGFSIQVMLYKDLKLTNITIDNINLKDSILFQYESNFNDTGVIITHLIISNCTFDNTTLFQFQNYFAGIEFQYVYISDSLFVNSSLIQYSGQSSQQSTLDFFFVFNCTISNSEQFLDLGMQNVKIQNFFGGNNTFKNSIIIESQANTQITTLRILETIFSQSYFFHANSFQPFNKILAITVDDIQIVACSFNNSSLFYIYKSEFQDTSVIILLLNVFNQQLKSLSSLQQQQSLYDFSGDKVTLQNIIIKDCQQLCYFRIIRSNIVYISNIEQKNFAQLFKIPISLSNFNQILCFPTLLYIIGFQNLTITKVDIVNQYSVDNSLISIFSDLLYQQNVIEIIKIEQVRFYGNLLLKTSLGQFFSLFLIYSDIQSIITFKYLVYEENYFHQLLDDPSERVASLLFISSLGSAVVVDNFTCSSNGLTNSQYSFISINSFELQIKNFKVNNHNTMPLEIWSKYYSFPTEFFIDTSNFFKLISIQVIGGACQLTSGFISITNSAFINILAQSSSVFFIVTQGQGIVQLQNISISNASIILYEASPADGSITVYSKQSLLQLTLENFVLQDVNNRLGPAILTIYPSSRNNYISLQKISILNCFSLINQILVIEFPETDSNQNHLIISGFKVVNSKEGWKKYFNQLSNQIEINKIQSQNGLINLSKCNIILKDCFFTGVFLSPVLLLIDINEIIVKDFQIYSAEVLYPLSLLSLQEINKLIINDIHLGYITLPSNKIFFDEDQTINSFVQSLNENQNLIGSLISVSGTSNSQKIFFNKITILYNKCSFCTGLVSMQQNTVLTFILKEMICYQNIIYENGCLKLSQVKSSNEEQGKIQNSVFIKNSGSNGVGILSSTTTFTLEKTIFLKNTATNNGGALYIDNIASSFLKGGSYILENRANIGGGIYAFGNISISKLSFENNLLIFNTAGLFANNLVEKPHHFGLSINSQEMIFTYTKTDLRSIQTLQLSQYYCIEQGSVIQTDTLLLPSSQKVADFKLFKIKKQSLTPYITEFSLRYKNQLNEILQGDVQDTCQIFVGDKDGDQKNFTFLQFNADTNSFEISELTFRLNPYSSNQKIFPLLFDCRAISSETSLFYSIKARPFKCQLGEFFQSESCQKCESAYGFYSVTYNASQCSIFDENKFVSITSNQIQLKNGYWRPNYESNLIEQCFKSRQWCVGGWGVNDNLCSQGHIGALCEECDIYNILGEGKYFKMNSTQCLLCTNSLAFLIPFVFLTFWQIISILVTLKSIHRTNKVFTTLKVSSKLFEVVFKLRQDFESILLKMLLNYAWIFSVIFTFNISFEFSFGGAIDQASNPSFYMATNFDCQFSQLQQIDLIYLRVLAMIIFMIMQCFLISAGFYLQSTVIGKPYDFSVIINTAAYLYVSNQAALIKSFGSLIALRQVSGVDYIQGDLTLLYYDQNHIKWIFVCILPGLIIFGVAIPLTLFATLFLSKKKFNQASFRKYFGYLFNEYNKENYFWEQIKIWKRSILIIILTYFEADISTKASFVCLTLLCYQLLAIRNKPYIINSLNILDVKAGQLVLITIFLAMIKYTNQSNHNLSVFLEVIIIILFAQLCFSFIHNIVRVYVKKYKFLFLSSMYFLAKKIKEDSTLTRYFQKKVNFYKYRNLQLQQNFEKLRQCLIRISRFQLEQQKKILSLTQLSSMRHSRNLTLDADTNRKISLSRPILQTQEK